MADITRGARGRKHPRNPGQLDLVTTANVLDAYTKSLMHFNAADGSVVMTDEAGKTWVVSGNAQIDTAQYKFGGSSLLLDGSGDFLRGDGSADFAFGTGDFTIDFWVRFASLADVSVIYDCRPNATQGLNGVIYYNNSSQKLCYFFDGADKIVGSTNITANTWHHVALARSGTSTKLFLNGTQEGATYTDSNNYTINANRPALGGGGYSDTVYNLNGWIDEFRVSKGIARWTANFTPPTSEY